ncbi:transposase [Streptomyces sp. NPDC060006]|uniref:transposase n=1 Tax=unclassified Streptomyces TaxID=2593676 RepID=UPI003680FE3D
MEDPPRLPSQGRRRPPRHARHRPPAQPQPRRISEGRTAADHALPTPRSVTGQALIVEAHGIPLAAITTGGNRNDVTQLIPLIQAVPPIRGKRGQPLRRPKRLYADRGYDHEVYRDKVRRFQITPHLARRGTGHGSGRGVYR